MFFKKFKQTFMLLLLSLFIIPSNALAYSEYIMAGGENIGIELNSKGVIIVGTYKINNNDPANDAKLQIGDTIVTIEQNEVNTIQEMVDKINTYESNKTIEVGYIRWKELKTTNLTLYKDNNGVIKTGLYVKDSITGVGTLSFIDPKTKLFGALGHEIIEKNSGQILEVKNGKIFETEVTSIQRSENGNPGEKNARFYTDKVDGSIFENTKQGVFGNYTADLPNKKLYKVAEPSEIKKGEAKILTVLNNSEIKEYSINILRISKDEQKNKNILFEITDKELLNQTGGIIQGMSGSPIIQGDYIIGAVTHVVVDDPTKGYGIFITNMLEEAEN